MLETIDLTKRFKQNIAVDGIGMYLEEGESVGLLGPNGAGKSTTISMISSLVKPTKGDVLFQGESILKNPKELRQSLGVVPQEIALYGELSAYENLKFFGRIYKLNGDFLEKRISETLELVGLEEKRKDLVKNFSGGMKRRLNIAAALLHEPRLVIMDEPTVGIDPQSRNHILNTVRKLNKEKQMTVLYTSHYMEEVENLCDRVYIMDKGKVIASGYKDELKRILSNEDTILIELERYHPSFVDSLKELPMITKITYVEKEITIIVPKNAQLLGDIFKLAEKHQAKIINVQIQNPSLEDVFLHLTGRKLRD